MFTLNWHTNNKLGDFFLQHIIYLIMCIFCKDFEK